MEMAVGEEVMVEVDVNTTVGSKAIGFQMINFKRMVFVSNVTTKVRTSKPGNLVTKKKRHKMIPWEALWIIDFNNTNQGSMMVIYLFDDISLCPNFQPFYSVGECYSITCVY